MVRWLTWLTYGRTRHVGGMTDGFFKRLTYGRMHHVGGMTDEGFVCFD